MKNREKALFITNTGLKVGQGHTDICTSQALLSLEKNPGEDQNTSNAHKTSSASRGQKSFIKEGSKLQSTRCHQATCHRYGYPHMFPQALRLHI